MAMLDTMGGSMVKFTKESPDDMYNRLHSEICGKKTSVNQINKLTNFFVEHPSYLPRGFHMLHNRFHAWRHMDDESLAETRDPRVKIAIACFNAVLRPPMLRYLPSRDWEDVWMWMNTFAKVIFDSKIPRVRSNALAPVATALRLASDRFPLHINDHAIKPVLTFWCGMAFDDTLREEIMQQHKSMTMDVLDLVQLFVNPLHFCKEWGAEELPCANKAEEHIHAEETNSLRSTAVKLVDRHAQELAIAAIRLLELYVTAAENASTKATEEYYLGAANSTMRSIHHLCCRLSFHTAYPYEASIPISMRGLALCSRYKLREATVTTVVKRAECFVSHLTYASDTPQASGLVKLALRHGLLQSLSALSPHLRWAGRQEYEKGGVQISANIIDKVLRLCILPSMVLEGPLRAAHKGLTSIDFPDASSMGAMSSTWSELYDRVRQIGPLLNDSATPCQYRQCDTIARKETLYQCGGCQTVFYCSRRCQKYDWKYNGHRSECLQIRKHWDSMQPGLSPLSAHLQRAICAPHFGTQLSYDLLAEYDENKASVLHYSFFSAHPPSVEVVTLEDSERLDNQHPLVRQWVNGGHDSD